MAVSKMTPPQEGGEPMAWEMPAFIEIKMDAEINAYQDDFSGI